MGLWMLVLEWLDRFDRTLDCLTVTPGLVPCTNQEQLLNFCPVLFCSFGSHACAISRAGQKVDGRVVLQVGEPCLGCQFYGDGLSETRKSFAFSVHLWNSRWLVQQVVGKQQRVSNWIYSSK